MLVYAVASQKGGVGKTTTTASLGAALAREGRRVLLVDMDPQASLTTALGQSASRAGTEDVLTGITDIAGARVKCACGVDLVPATARLAVTLVQLAQGEVAPLRLKLALRRVRDEYDFVFIDCPPTLSHAITNALTAADFVLVPLQCEYLALRALFDMQDIIKVVRESTNPSLRMRVIATMLDRRSNHGYDVLCEARAALPGLVYDTPIPRTIRLAEAPAVGDTVFEFAPESTGAEAFIRLGKEILEEAISHEQTRFDSSRDAEPALFRAA